MTKKLTPRSVEDFRKDPMIIKWRASCKNGTLIKNPTIRERLDAPLYQKLCHRYMNNLLSSVIAMELKMYDSPLQLKCEDYYYRRYDVTFTECQILRNEILSRLTI